MGWSERKNGNLMKNSSQEAKEIIRTLIEGEFYAECSCCGREIALKDAGLFYSEDFTRESIALRERISVELKSREKRAREDRKKISIRSEIAAASINQGKIIERFAPSMPKFPFDTNDCRSLFDPIDYVIFDGLDKTGGVKRIIFADIKTGDAPLTPRQKRIKTLVEEHEVKLQIY